MQVVLRTLLGLFVLAIGVFTLHIIGTGMIALGLDGSSTLSPASAQWFDPFMVGLWAIIVMCMVLFASYAIGSSILRD